MKPRIKVFFRWTPYNRYTVAALIGLLDEELEASEFEVTTFEDPKVLTKETLSRGNDIIVASYSFTSAHAAAMKEEMSGLKSTLGRKIVIICGGPHVSALPESFAGRGADACLVGEGEVSLPLFLRTLAEKGTLPSEKIIGPGDFEDFESYPPFACKRNLFAPIEIRRGCRVGCSFCQTPRIFPRTRERGLEYILHYSRMLKKNGNGTVLFTIPDALSYGSVDEGVNLPAIKGLLENLTEMGMKTNFGTFPSEVSPRRLTLCPEAAGLLKEHASNTKVALGGQSGSQRVLDTMRRDHTVEDIRASARILADNGLVPIIDILLGTPGENREDRLETIKLMKDLYARHKARFNAHYFMPLPGTPFYGKAPEPVEPVIIEEIAGFLKSGVAVGDFFDQLAFSSGDLSCE